MHGEGVHFSSQPACVLAHRVVALHTVGVNGPTDRRHLEHGFHLGEGPIDHACGDMEDPTVLPLFDHNGIAQVQWWTAAGMRKTAACPLAQGCHPHLHLQQGFGIVGQGITGKEGDVAIGRCFELGNQLSRSAEVRLPTTQASASLLTGLKAIQTRHPQRWQPVSPTRSGGLPSWQ